MNAATTIKIAPGVDLTPGRNVDMINGEIDMIIVSCRCGLSTLTIC
jgi:hypothetical protein